MRANASSSVSLKSVRLPLVELSPSGLLFKFTHRDMVTSGLLGSGTVYAEKYGTSGTPTHLKFVLQQP